jgi:hypothetical protein
VEETGAKNMFEKKNNKHITLQPSTYSTRSYKGTGSSDNSITSAYIYILLSIKCK